MNLFQEAKEVLDKSGKVNPLGPYGRQKLTGREGATYFRRNKVKDAKLKRAVEVALDLGGAMSVAQKEIKKFYGNKIANSPEVQSALKYANESVEFTLDMISEDEVKVNHENPKDRGDQKKFRKVIQLGKQAKIKLLDGGGRGYRAQGNKSQVQKFKDLMSKEFGKSISFNERYVRVDRDDQGMSGLDRQVATKKAEIARKRAEIKKREDRAKAERKKKRLAKDKERVAQGKKKTVGTRVRNFFGREEFTTEALTNMPEPVQNRISMLRNKRMDVPHGSPEYVRIGKQIDQMMSKYSKKLNNEVEKVKEEKKLNEFDTIRKMWEGSIEENSMERSIMKKMRKGKVAKGMPR